MMLLSRVTYGFSILCFFTAFCFPAFSTDAGPSDSLAVFAFGWLGLFVNPAASFPWLANIFYSASLASITWNKDKRLVLILSLTSFLLAISFLGVKTIVITSGGQERLVISYGVGYWMWASAPFIMMTGLLIEIKKLKKCK